MKRLAACWLIASAPSLGQTLNYVGEWRLFDAGKVQAYLGDSSARIALQTAGLADKIYSVRNAYAVQYDRALCAAASTEDALEGKKHREIKVTYGGGKSVRLERDLKKGGETTDTKELAIPSCVHDVLGALEKLRRTPTAAGTAFRLPVTDGRKVADVEIQAQERETIRTPAGVFHTIRHEAMLFNGVLFRRKARLFIWLTDDARRLPVQFRVQMPFYIGSVTLQLDKEGPG